MKEYIIGLHNFDDLEEFYEDMETPGGNLYIPERAVDCQNKRPISRNTHYLLTPEEAELISQDPRVAAVSIAKHEIGVTIRPFYTDTSIYWNKSSIPQNFHKNWGMLRATLKDNSSISNWGSNAGLGEVEDVSGTVSITATGKHVDVIIVDGHIDPSHPEFAVNADGSGGSRVIQYNWFQHNPAVTGAAAGTYVYTPYVDPTYGDNNGDGYSDRSHNNDHGCHVAGTACGNTYGWARDANIYNISPYSTNPNLVASESIFDYVREFHKNKPINPLTGRKNPTIVNNSWGAGLELDLAATPVTVLGYRNNGFTNPLEAKLVQSGLQVSDGLVDLPYYESTLELDVQDCISKGIIFVGAAGNSSYKMDTLGGQDYNNYITVNYFGTTITFYYHRGSSPVMHGTAICVGCSDATPYDNKAFFSNSGPRVDIFSPGRNIISVINSNDGTPTYDYRNEFKYVDKKSGTSMASPQVTGMIACILEVYPNATQNFIRLYLQDSAQYNQMPDTGETEFVTASNTYPYFSLFGGPNRFMYYRRERPVDGAVYPRTNQGIRQSSGQVFPRPRIYRYGPQT